MPQVTIGEIVSCQSSDIWLATGVATIVIIWLATGVATIVIIIHFELFIRF